MSTLANISRMRSNARCSFYGDPLAIEREFDSKGSDRHNLNTLSEQSNAYREIVQSWTGGKIVLNFVPSNFDVYIRSGGASIHVLGDVCEDARLFALGGGASIVVDGYACDRSELFASGGGASVKVGVASNQADLHATGGGALVEADERHESLTSISWEVAVFRWLNDLDESDTLAYGWSVITEINKYFGINCDHFPQRTEKRSTPTLKRFLSTAQGKVLVFTLFVMVFALFVIM